MSEETEMVTLYGIPEVTTSIGRIIHLIEDPSTERKESPYVVVIRIPASIWPSPRRQGDEPLTAEVPNGN